MVVWVKRDVELCVIGIQVNIDEMFQKSNNNNNNNNNNNKLYFGDKSIFVDTIIHSCNTSLCIMHRLLKFIKIAAHSISFGEMNGC